MKISELKELLKNTDYPFLGASKGMWINADKKELYLSNMEKSYINNCYYMLKKQRPNIKDGACLISIEHNMGKELNEDEQDKIKEMTIKLCDKKLQELEKFLY